MNVGDEGFSTSEEINTLALDRIKRIMNQDGAALGIKTLYSKLDNITGGFQDSDLIILGGRPGEGKTAIALEFIRRAAVVQGIPVGVFSLEMEKTQLFHRLQSQESQIDLEKIMRKGMSEHELKHLIASTEALSKSPIYIDDSGGLTITKIKSRARKLKRDKKIGLLVIDYVQLIKANSSNKTYNRANEVGEISKELKNLAKELKVPVIALVQLSRASEQNKGGEPKLSDIRESGDLEQDADMVAFVFRPEYHGITEDSNGNSTIGKAMFMIKKHRNGPTDNVLFDFKGSTMTFTGQDDIGRNQRHPASNQFPSAIAPSLEFDKQPINDKAPWED